MKGKSVDASYINAHKNVEMYLRAKHQPKLSLAQWGVDLRDVKAEFETGIINGFRPQFGCPLMDFRAIKEGIDALSCE